LREIRITVRCVHSPMAHAKVVRVKARLGRGKAQDLADLLDGSSLAYVHPPGPQSPIGRCCVCGGECSAEVSEIIDGTEVPLGCDEAVADAARKEAKGERKLEGALTTEALRRGERRVAK
jgi:hypothetical protein